LHCNRKISSYDVNGRAVVGEGHREIGRALQLEADHGVACGFLQHDTAEVHVGDHLRRVESVVGRFARDIRLPGGAMVRELRGCEKIVGAGVGYRGLFNSPACSKASRRRRGLILTPERVMASRAGEIWAMSPRFLARTKTPRLPVTFNPQCAAAFRPSFSSMMTREIPESKAV
jgi:hypothetical protein